MRIKMFKGTVLLVTLNERLRNNLRTAMLQAGYMFMAVRNQDEALRKLRTSDLSIIVVDRHESGFLRLHHETPFRIPIVTIAHHAEGCDEQHCIQDLENGAARAVCNASSAMVVALTGAILRRQRWDRSVSDLYRFDGVTIDLQNYTVSVAGTPVNVKPTEFRILKSLAIAPGHFLSRNALIDRVWGEDYALCPHTLDVHISSIRQQLVPYGVSSDFVSTVRGLGFKLRSASARSKTPVDQSSPLVAQAFTPQPVSVRQPRARAMKSAAAGGAPWRHTPAEALSARYRIKPAQTRDEQ
ncbi:response regulator transcription factor [Nitrospira lenta]|uniref:OmpR/PhoB-type domain-containing protein n=1 Tax=Nitrospira lenta TaxID=1436998 RepID=A0A330L181_9BACT|nr:response regulator transcription factor [Nitrospira lenta]SPP62973.1 hypothetical protein NITLEN_10059 [Nitrospira lenta]